MIVSRRVWSSGARPTINTHRLVGLAPLDRTLRIREKAIDRIAPYLLWVGHAGDGGNPARLHELGIEAIVQVAAEEAPLTPPRSLVYHRIPLLDGPGNSPEMLAMAVGIVASLARLRVPTLVCCGMGMSRSPAIVAAAMAWVERESVDSSLRRVGELHPVDVSPGLWRDVREVDPGLWCGTLRP